MPFCQECGSQVAENIIFCPYCGVNQTPAADGGDFSPTPVNPANEEAADELQINSNISATEEFKVNQNKEGTAVALAAENNSNEENENSDGSEYENSEQNELDQVKQRQEDLNEDIEKAKYENFQIDKQTAINESEVPETRNPIFIPGENEIKHDSETQSESEMMSYDEAEVKEVEELQEVELKTPGNSPSDEQIDEIETPSENLSEAENAVENTEDEDTLQNLPKSESAQAKPILKPETELESAEASCPPPMYDSVRIMETPISDKISETGRYNQFAQKSVGAPQKIPILEIQNSLSTKVDKHENKISYTAQNISEPNTDGRKSAKLKPLEEGTVLNARYEIVRKIGGGGMGAVYLASDKNLGGVLRAVKEMVQSYIEDEQQEKAISDFKRESLLLTSLEHQSIPTIYDYFFDEKEARFYLVMKYISGGDLASRLRSAPENRIEEKIVTEWAIQVADVLDYLHNRQPAIIYRDLKPSNIMVDGNSNRVMLVDFGIARWVNKEDKGVTAVGTMGYAPPELFSGNVEPRSDIYSLGSTLFHLLTGADPQSNPLLIFDFQKHPRPRQINPQISDQMEKILMRAVEYSAERRFSSAAELRDALIAHLDKLKANKVSYGVKETPAATGFAEQYVFCGFCGQKIVANDLFCAFCGAKQPLAQNGVNIQERIGGQFTAQISILGTSELETPTFQIEKDENLVGRRDPMSNIFPEIDLSKFDPNTKISRRHARIWRDGNKYLVEDLGSSNGTIVLPAVNETFRLAPHQPVALNSGDKLKLGDTTLHFVVA